MVGVWRSDGAGIEIVFEVKNLIAQWAQDGFDADINRVVKDKSGSVLDSYDVVSSYSATSNRVLVGTGQ